MIIGVTVKVIGMHNEEVTLIALRPLRHHNIINLLSFDRPSRLIEEPEGFITDKGVVLNRKEAADYALSIGQIDFIRWPPDLYSEDLWNHKNECPNKNPASPET